MLRQIKRFCAGSLLAAAVFTSFSSTGHAALIVGDSVNNQVWNTQQIIFSTFGPSWQVTTQGSASLFDGAFARSTDEVAPFEIAGNPAAIYLLPPAAFMSEAVEGSDNWIYFQGTDGNFGWVQFDLRASGLGDSSVLRYVYDDSQAHVALQDAIAAIPEPSSVVYLSLLGGGLFLWALSRQRKAKTVV